MRKPTFVRHCAGQWVDSLDKLPERNNTPVNFELNYFIIPITSTA